MAAMVQPPSQPLLAPPGLDNMDMTPAKVELQGSRAMAAWPPQDCLQPCYAPISQSNSSGVGEWVNAVMAVAPHLDQQGLKKALSIVDGAIGNARQAKALGQLLSTGMPPKVVNQLGLGSNMWQAAEYYRVQLADQQQALLRELQQLCLFNGSELPLEESLQPDSASAAADSSVSGKAAQAAPRGGRQKGGEARREQNREQRGKQRSEECSDPPVSVEGEDSLQGDELQKALGARQVQTLSTSLQLLSNEDPDCLFIVRRINKLGFKAARTLKRHFSAYGTVVRVLAAHSTVRQHGDPQCHARRRPSSLGFVQMANTESVGKILELGDEQDIEGAMIRVQRFKRQHGVLAEEVEEDTVDRQGQSSGQSEASSSQQSPFSPRCSMTPSNESTAASLSDVHSQAVDSVGDSE
mmetsp:Transcript_24439/g.42764  ORF Transcript_24439/g.42764 Transcript_24439/m.42764 type:complete len:410 (-) Transcript_24439:163-1392(-)